MQVRFAALAAAALVLRAGDSPGGARPQFFWEGDVTDSCIIKVHANQVQATEADGSAARHQHYHFSVKLPDTNQNLRLQTLHGRGVVRFLSQPSLTNDYTAVIRIDDPQPGSSHYSISLEWAESSYDQPNAPRSAKTAPANEDTVAADHAASWSGHVTGTVRVSIRGGSSYSQVVSGELTGEHADVAEPVPHRAGLKFTVKKVSGGGEVQVVEAPSESNGYTLTFEVRNGKATDSDYAVDIGWAPQVAPR
ncbi:MAG TPA: hypothetical protein VFA04_00500 [Bryobacteraceae bacterium]|nr:hypothetical protein [Bryobacteraceae bacterium]